MKLKIKLVRLSFLERFFLYIVAYELADKIVFQAAMGMHPFDAVRYKLLIFYVLLLVESAIYALGSLRRASVSLSTAYLVLALTSLVLLGFVIGLLNGNSKVGAINDAVPLIFLAINAFRFNDPRQLAGFSYDRAAKIVLGGGAVLSVAAFGLRVTDTQPIATLGSGPMVAVFWTFVLTSLFYQRNRKLALFAALLCLLATFDNSNRTTLAAIALSVFVVLLAGIKTNIRVSAGIAALAFLGLFSVAFLLPEDSRLAQRLNQDIAAQSEVQTGAIGERIAEQEAIEDTIRARGPSAEAFGLGFGARYSFQSTWKYIEDNGHAHFGWALMNLRFGLMGQILLVVYGALMVLLIMRDFIYVFLNGRKSDPVVTIGLFIRIWSILFIPTWFVFNFHISGLQFLGYSARRARAGIVIRLPTRKLRFPAKSPSRLGMG